MNPQLDIFNPPPLRIHVRENSPESEKILSDNRDHLTDQVRKLIEVWCTGERVTTTTALRYGIGDLRARARDAAKINGIAVQKKLIEGRYKEYFLLEEEIKICKQRFGI